MKTLNIQWQYHAIVTTGNILNDVCEAFDSYQT